MSDVAELGRRIAGLSPQRQAYLAQLLHAKAAPAEAAPLRPCRRAPGENLPCSFAQQRLWFLDRLEPESSAYTIITTRGLPGRLDVDALERALQEIVRRHEVLRTTFAEVGGEPVQRVAAEGDLPLRQVALAAQGRAEAAAELQALIAAEERLPFDLERGPLLRATLVRVSPASSVLVLAMRHIVTDGWSMKVLFDELQTLYAAFAAGRPSPLAPLPIQYADFAIWQRAWLQGDVLAKQVAYWRGQLAGVPRLELPVDRPRPALKSHRGASHGWRLPRAITRGLRELCRAEGTTLFMALLAAFATLLSRHSGQRDIAVGTPIANRTRAELEGLLGFFVNTLVFRVDLAGAPTFRELLGRVREKALGAYAHQDLPFERLVEELQPPRDLGRNPLFDVMFQLQSSANPLHYVGEEGAGDERAGENGGDGTPRAPLPVRTISVFDLSLDMWENGDDLAAQFEYSTDLFDPATIVRMAGHFVTLAEAAVAEPDRPVRALPMLSAEERVQLLADAQGHDLPLPEASLAELFAQQASRTPEAVAVRDGATWTYAELRDRTGRLARALRARGIGRGDVVALRFPRSAALIEAMLGVLEAGAAYLPIDLATPPARVDALRADAGAALLLDPESLAALAPREDRGDASLLGGQDAPTPDDLAYVLYTSGSTGAPKGVEVAHRSLVHHALAIGRAFALTPADCLLQLASPAFDVAGEEIFPALIAGAKVACADEDTPRSPEALLAQVERDGVTVLNLPTPLWEAWLPVLTARALPACLRLLVVGSDRAGDGALRRWQARASKTPIRLLHGYGVTEATITSLLAEVPDGAEALLLGPPLGHTEALVFDADLQLLPIGVPGELHLGGAGLARGYRARPSLTAERFLPHPFRPGERLYRTGDRVRRRADGHLELSGRLDDQVKVQGVRIEPAEIEAALERHPAVKTARILVREDTPGDRRLVAYLVGAGDEPPAADSLARFLREHLPEAMIPSAYVALPALPLTRNLKLDRAALPAPGTARPELQTRYAAPRDQLERSIAEVWREVLQIDEVGREDNFFDVGGRSLLLVRVFSRLRESYGESLAILDCFRYPTIRALADYLRRAGAPEPRA